MGIGVTAATISWMSKNDIPALLRANTSMEDLKVETDKSEKFLFGVQ
jgi:hypothetical protein